MTAAVCGLILAGGRSTRMGGADKAFINAWGKPMVLHVYERVRTQVVQVMVSANANFDRYEHLNLPVVSDLPDISSGPLSGILAGLRHAASDWLLAVPTDMPCLPQDLVKRMLPAVQRGHNVAVAHDGVRRQNAVMLIHRGCADEIERYLGRASSIHGWLAEVDCVEVNYSDLPDAFVNVNTAADLAALVSTRR